MKNNIFYTYIYLDPRKSGSYSYGDYTFNFEPFYVGKGKESRWKEHLKRAFRNNNDQMFFYNKIRKVKDQTGRFPAVQLVEENLTEQEAFELEIWLIWAIGRKYFGGCLTNLSDGGTGTCGTPSWAKGITRSDEYKKKMSERTSGTNAPWYGKRHDEEYKRKMSESLKGPQAPMYGKKMSDEAKEKMSLAKKGKPSPMKGKKQNYTPEALERIIDANKRRSKLNKEQK